MTPRRILITGAAGFVGRHMLVACRSVWPDALLVAACQSEDLHRNDLPGADVIVRFDLTDPASISRSVEVAKPDACIHLAALSDVAASFEHPDAAWAVNVDGTRALASALRQHTPDALLLHAGSAEAYGLSFAKSEPLDETAQMLPANPYAASKAAIDLALGEMALRGLRVIRMRPLNHIGPGQSPRFVVASFARQIARIESGEQEPVIHTGPLDRSRDFLDVRDVCAAYTSAILYSQELPPGAIFNLASGRVRLLADVLSSLLELSSAKVFIETKTVAPRPVDISVTRCNTTYVRSALNWRPMIPWRSTLGDVLGYWREMH